MFALVIPSYDNAKTLQETLGSLLLLEERHRIELILSDDGSTDGSQDFLKAWVEKHREDFGRLVLNLNAVNLGSSANHGKGFSLARSEYGVYIGADDLIINPSFPRELEEALAANPKVRLARTDVIAHDRPKNLKWRVFARHGHFFRFSARRQFALFVIHHKESLWMCGPGTVVHVQTLLNTPRAIDSRCKYIEDSHLYLAMAGAGIAIRYLPVQGIVWVRSPEGRSYLHDGRFDFSLDEKLREEELIRPYLYKIFPWEWLIAAFHAADWPFSSLSRWLNPFYRDYDRGPLYL
jgi:glycosyltransferase involved in cell wall biosynthesis